MAKLPSEETFDISKDFGEALGGEYTLTLKVNWTGADGDYVSSKVTQMVMDTEGKVETIYASAGNIAILKRVIKSWNVMGEDDSILPVTYDNVGKLPGKVTDWALMAWNGTQPKKD